MMKFCEILFIFLLTISFLKDVESTAVEEDFGNSTIYVLDDTGKPVMGITKPAFEVHTRIFGFDEPTIDDIHFYLYTSRDALDNAFELFVNKSDNLKNSPFNRTNPTKILIHGFANTYKGIFSQQAKNTYLNNGKYNVIIVDWGKLAASPFYVTASINTRFVGQTTAQLIDNLVQEDGMQLKDLHIIGHSLGAHTAGIIGKHVKSGRVGRITGLDPALPLYDIEYTGDEWRLTKDDAKFVDVIHTASGILGFSLPLGDNDYYPNGGRPIQPGCSYDIGGSCSHSRSWEYFIETIPNAVAFPTTPCENLEQVETDCCECFRRSSQITAPNMGEKAYKDRMNKLFYTKTRSEKPFTLT